MAANNVILGFDLYGTLLDTSSIAKKLSEFFGEEKGPSLAATWRVQQLEYTWRLNSMNVYEPFSAVTQKSLQHTLAENGLSLSNAQTSDLMKAYDSLGTFQDVPPALDAISKESGITAVVFSNGTDSMVSNSVNKSPSLSPHASAFKQFVTVEKPKRYKPDPAVYKHLGKEMGKTEQQMGDMWLISGNPFDIVGARKIGMKAAWVDRAGKGWTDRLGEQPTVIVRGLGEVVEAVKKHA